MADLDIEEEAFYYVDGMPTKGCWIKLHDGLDEDEIKATLADQGFIPRDEDGDPDYDGDLLVADVDGVIAHHFLSKYDTFDLDGWIEVCEEKPQDVTVEAVAAYLGNFGSWSKSHFEDAYCGEWDSELKYAEDLFDECWMHEVPEHVRAYIDYEKFARDLFLGDYIFIDGYVFRSC